MKQSLPRDAGVGQSWPGGHGGGGETAKILCRKHHPQLGDRMGRRQEAGPAGVHTLSPDPVTLGPTSQMG